MVYGLLGKTSPNGPYQRILGAPQVFILFTPPYASTKILFCHKVDFDLMKESSGLLGALNVEIAQLLVMQRGSGAAVSLHTDQVSGEMLFESIWGTG